MKHNTRKWTSYHLSTKDWNLLFVLMGVILTVFDDIASREHTNIYINENITHTTITDICNRHKDKSAFEILS